MQKQGQRMTSSITEVAFNIIASMMRSKSGRQRYSRKNNVIKDYYLEKYINTLYEHLDKSFNMTGDAELVKFNPLIDLAYEAGVLEDDDLILFNTCYRAESFVDDVPYLTKDISGYYFFSSDIRQDKISRKEFFKIGDPLIIYSDLVAMMFMDGILLDFMQKNREKIRNVLDNKIGIGKIVF